MDQMARSDTTAPAITTGSESSFEDFFRREFVRLGRALYLLTGTRQDAEDLAAEAMTRVCERWDRVGEMESPAGYLYRVGMNLFRKWVGQATRKDVELPEDASVDDPTSAVDTKVQVLNALSRLSVEQREAMVMVEWLGLSAGEAGEVLGIEPVSVRARLHRARQALRKDLERSEP